MLSRQALPPVPHAGNEFEQIQKGGYIVGDNPHELKMIIIATGSEVHLAMEAARSANALGMGVRVVSMPCVERFLSQDQAYQEHVLPITIKKRLAVEAAATGYWYRFVGLDGKVLGIDTFGVSAPAQDAYAYFGLTVEGILASLKTL